MHPSRTGVRSSIGAWLLAMLAVLASIPTTQAEPTFDETIDFIRRTVEEHGQFRNIAGGGRIRVKLAQVLGRRLRFRTIATDGIPGSLDRSESTEFSLADLDPDATHVRLWFAGERQAFAVWMTDAGRVSGVRRWQDANEEMPARSVSSGWIAVDDETQAQALAKALNYTFIDSGAMYRAVAFYCLEQGFISDDDEIDSTQLLQQLDQISINLSSDQKVWLNNQDITEVIRSPKVAGIVSKVAAIKAVRTKLVELQRQMSVGGGIVMDGRDIGTVVFPDAELKIFVTASIEVRTQRRLAELKAKGEVIDEVAVQQNLLDRDHQDSTRAESPLKQAAEAVVLDTSALNREEQLAWALARVALLVVTN